MNPSTKPKKKVDVAKYTTIPVNPELPHCIIVDIDGTLAHMIDRSPYDYSRVSEDVVDDAIRGILYRYAKHDPLTDIPDTYIVILSGREAGCRNETMEWLNVNRIPYDEFYMRASDDKREDSVVKKEIYDDWIKPRFNVRFVLDDRDRVVKMWRDQGLKCLQAQPGDF